MCYSSVIALPELLQSAWKRRKITFLQWEPRHSEADMTWSQPNPYGVSKLQTVWEKATGHESHGVISIQVALNRQGLFIWERGALQGMTDL